MYYDFFATTTDCLLKLTQFMGNGSDRLCCQILAKVYEIMIFYVMKIYDMNMKLYMQECMIENVQRMHMSILW